MAQTFKTYDGVEVGIGATIYMTGEKPSIDATPNEWVVEADDIKRKNETEYRYFSTKEACQAYIDEVNKPKSIMGEEWDKTIVDGLQITNEKWVQMLGRANRASTPPPRIEYAPTPNGQMATEATAETKPLRSFISPYLAELLSAMNEPSLITEQIGDAKVTTWEDTSIAQTEPMFRKPRVVVPPTPKFHFFDDNEQMPKDANISELLKERKKAFNNKVEYAPTPTAQHPLMSILTQFSEAYKIPINDILEFIINQKSNQ